MPKDVCKDCKKPIDLYGDCECYSGFYDKEIILTDDGE